MGHQTAALPVQQKVLPPARVNPYGRVSCHLRDFVRMDTCGIHHVPGPHRPRVSAAGGDLIATFFSIDMPNLEIQQQIHPVVHGVADGGDGQLVWADDGGGGGVERTGYLIRQGRLQRPCLLPFQDAQLFHAVADSSGIECTYHTFVFFSEAYDQRPIPPIRHAQLSGHCLHHPGTAHVQPGFQASLRRVISRMDDTGIRMGRPHRHIVFLLQDAHLEVICRQGPGQHPSHDSCSYDCYVIHILPCLSPGFPPLPRPKPGIPGADVPRSFHAVLSRHLFSAAGTRKTPIPMAYVPVFPQAYRYLPKSSSSRWISRGLGRWAFMPLSRDFLRSSSKELAETAMMGTVDSAGSSSARMALVAW